MKTNTLRMFLILSCVACIPLHPSAQPTDLRKPGSGAYEERQKSTKADTSEFHRLAGEWKEAYNSKNTARLAALYAEDADYLSSHVAGLVAHGREKIRANFQTGIDSGGHIDDIRIVSSSLSCNLAYLVCIYEATNAGQKVSGRSLIVSKKSRGKWLIVSHMTVVAG